jgi:hypothetical protein
VTAREDRLAALVALDDLTNGFVLALPVAEAAIRRDSAIVRAELKSGEVEEAARSPYLPRDDARIAFDLILSLASMDRSKDPGMRLTLAQYAGDVRHALDELDALKQGRS